MSFYRSRPFKIGDYNFFLNNFHLLFSFSLTEIYVTVWLYS